MRQFLNQIKISKMNTKFKIVETEEYYLAVSDEDINLGDYCYVNEDDSIYKSKGNVPSNRFVSKVIAYLPKNNAPELDLPLLPEIIIEPRGFDEFQYTEQDMINLAKNISYEWYSEKLIGILDSARWTDNYLQSLNKSKTPTHFQVEVEYIRDYDLRGYTKPIGTELKFKFKTKLIDDYKETLVGKYLFE